VLRCGACCLQAVDMPPGAAQATSQVLTASLANTLGGVVAGTLAGPMMAAGPVTLVLGLFGAGNLQQSAAAAAAVQQHAAQISPFLAFAPPVAAPPPAPVEESAGYSEE
jgi:hypothetical protein